MPEELKLGKKAFVPSEHDYTLVRFLGAAELALPAVPNRFGHGLMFKDWLMLGNGPDDTVEPGFAGCGDCVFAGGDHETMMTNHIAKKTVTFTGANAVEDYSAVTGYVLDDDSTDQGTEVRSALSYRRKTGLIDEKGQRHQIGGYVSINPKNWDELMVATYIFTAVGIGFEFPDYAMDQFMNGENWDVVDSQAQIDGGHYVPIVGRRSRNVAGCVSWAKRQGMTRDFYETYNDEAWAIVYPEELRNGKTERGYSLSDLNQFLSQLK